MPNVSRGDLLGAPGKRFFYACTREDAARVGFDDQFIYDEIAGEIDNRKIETINFLREEAIAVFENWEKKADKIEY